MQPRNDLIEAQRRGMTLVELIAAATVLGAVGAALAPLLMQVHDARVLLAQQDCAWRELRHLAESFPDQLPETLELSPLIVEQLPDVRLSVIRPPAPPLQRVDLSLSWINPHGERTQPCVLSFWTLEELPER